LSPGARPVLGMEAGRASQVPGEPPCVRAPLFDPDGISALGHSCAPDAAFHSFNSVGSRQYQISRLNHAAHTLAVYASQPGLIPGPRKTRFRLLASFAGRALPAGLLREVSAPFLHGFLLTQALPGALNALILFDFFSRLLPSRTVQDRSIPRWRGSRGAHGNAPVVWAAIELRRGDSATSNAATRKSRESYHALRPAMPAALATSR
jgi:hypothetical protein